MSACTFFGHRDCPSSIKSKLRKVLIDLIESHAVDMFYVGQQGSFDSMVHSVLKELVSLWQDSERSQRQGQGVPERQGRGH